jgi:hypothetical protein
MKTKTAKYSIMSMDHRIEGLPLYTLLLLLPSSPFNRGQLKFPQWGPVSGHRVDLVFTRIRVYCWVYRYRCLVLDGGECTTEYHTRVLIYTFTCCLLMIPSTIITMAFPQSCSQPSFVSVFISRIFPSGGSVGRGKPRGT